MALIRVSRSFFGAAGTAVVALALVGAVRPAAAGNADATMAIASDPTVASVSRDATTLPPTPAADFYVSYTVRITNPSNSSKNFRFVGDVTVSGAGATVPTNLVSSRRDCTLTTSNPVRVTCPRLEVARQATVTFTLQFRTPTGGDQMALLGSLFFPNTSTSLVVSTSATTQLVKLSEPEYTLGFNTFVPSTGGTFWTGVGSSLLGSPGGVATGTDPFTTTIVVPRIGFTTTATAAELQKGELTNCSAFSYPPGGCFSSSLTIPSAKDALAGLQIYLRMDRSKVYQDASINAAVIRYSQDGTTNFIDVPNCSAPGVVPAVVAKSGVPCIRARKVYPLSAPDDWRLDWEFLIEATDNGRYLN